MKQQKATGDGRRGWPARREGGWILLVPLLFLSCTRIIAPEQQLLHEYQTRFSLSSKALWGSAPHLYALGKIAMERSYADLAVRYFSQALKQKSHDSLQEGYFVNRELGIAYFRRAVDEDIYGYLGDSGLLPPSSEKERRLFNARLRLRQVMHYCTLAIHYLRFSLKDVPQSNKRAQGFLQRARALKQLRASTLQELERY